MIVAALALALQPAPAALPAGEIAFVTQCRFPGGPRIILAHRFNTANYRFVINRGPNDNLLVTIVPARGGPASFDSEGTVSDVEAVGRLFDWLLGHGFRAVPRDRFPDEFTRENSQPCPAGYRIPR